jgi:hypothetical protein
VTSLTLYEIGAAFERLEATLIESAGEWTPEVEAALGELGEMEKHKVDAYRAVVLRFEQHAANCGDEARVLADKASHARHAAIRLKDHLKQYMELRGVTELKGDLFKASIQRNGGVQGVTVLVATEALDRTLCTVTVAPNLEQIRAAAGSDGRVVDATGTVVAELVPKGTHLRFR